MKYLVVCHGDGDGIIGAACIIKEYKLPMDKTKIVFTQPFLLDQVEVKDKVKAIFVVDLSVNNHNLSVTLNFADKYYHRIVTWVSHHYNTEEKLARILGPKLLCDKTAHSCPAIMVNSGYEEVSTTWVKAANAINKPTEYPETPLSKRFEQAFKVSLIEAQDGNNSMVEKIQRAFLSELLTGEEEGLLNIYGARYESVMRATQKAAESFFEFRPGIGLVVLGDAQVDRAAVCSKGCENFLITVVQFHSLENGDPMTMIATNNKDLNLVTTFELPSGNPSKVTLPGNLKKTRDMIIYKLS